MSLAAVAALAARLPAIGWFAAVGAQPDRDAAADVAAYLTGLGLASAPVAGVADWRAAQAVADAPDWDHRWWDAEERARQALLADAGAAHGRPVLLAALTAVTDAAAAAAQAAADAALARAGIGEPGLARAAGGAALQAAYLAGLALAAGADGDHPFARKLALFEHGRWPLGLLRGAFRLF